MTSSEEITELLIHWCDGDRESLERLMPLVENKLHQMAHYYMSRESPGHTLQTTALVNEAFLKLVDQNRVRWQNRAHFFGIAAQIMRRILINYARDQKRLKRGDGALHLSLSHADGVIAEKFDELIALDDALRKLSEIDERKSKVVELRFFGGLGVDETAEFLNISTVTVNRDWNLAKAWLAREITHGT